MTQQFFVPGPLPGLNAFLGKGSRWTYTEAKQVWGWQIKVAILQAKLTPMVRVYIRWTWQEEDERRDPDNFQAIGKKLILDSLVNSGILKNDGWKQISGWTDHWLVEATKPGVGVMLEERG